MCTRPLIARCSNKLHPCEELPRAIFPSDDGCYDVLSDRRRGGRVMSCRLLVIYSCRLLLLPFSTNSLAATVLSCARLLCNTACSASASASSEATPCSASVACLLLRHPLLTPLSREPSFPAALDVRAAKNLGVPKVCKRVLLLGSVI